MAANVTRVLSSYQILGTRAYNGLASATSLDVSDAHDLLHHVVLHLPALPFLLACHALYVALVVRRITRGREFWLKSLILTVCGAFGGSTLSCVLLGEPAPLFTTASNVMFGYVLIAWWVVEVFPLLRHLFEFRVFMAMLTFFEMIVKGRNVLSFVDKVLGMGFEGGIGTGTVILAGLSGTGGLLLITMDRKLKFGRAAGKGPFSEPGWGFKSPYLIAGIYYVGIDPFGWFADALGFKIKVARDVAKFWLILGLACHATVETLINRNINPVYLVEQFLYAVSRVSPKSVLQEDGPSTSEHPNSQEDETTVKREREMTVKSEGDKNGTLRQRRKARAS